MLGDTYNLFGNGYVPMNVIIGGGNRIIYSDNDMPSDAIINQAIASLTDYISLTTPVLMQEVNIGQSITIDLSNACTSSDGSAITYTVQSISTPAMLSGTITGTTLTLTAAQTTGRVKTRIKATRGSICGYFDFWVKIKDPSLAELLTESFDTFPLIGWENSNWEQRNAGVYGKCAGSSYQPAGTNILTSSSMVLPVDSVAILAYYWKNNDISKIVGYDSTFCEITDDNGATWAQLAVLSAASPQSAFVRVEKDLAAYKNKTVKIRWRYKTDGSQQAYGIGLDEVVIYYKTVGIANNDNTPLNFSLNQNYPNPFNPSTTITFNLQTTSDVKLAVYNQTGAEVAVKTESRLNQGLHSFNFDGSKLNSGVYYYTLTANKQQKSGKMLLLK